MNGVTATERSWPARALASGALLWIGLGLASCLSSSVPVVFPLVCGVLWLLTTVRPALALVLLAGLVSLAAPVPALVGEYPFRFPEGLVLAFLGGMTSRVVTGRLPRQGQGTTGELAPALCFGGVVVASCALRTIAVTEGLPARQALSELALFMTRDYLSTDVHMYRALVPAGLLIEGLALFIAVAALVRQSPSLRRHVLTISVLAGTTAAAAALVQLGRLAWALGGLPAALQRWPDGLSVHTTDVNAAGSHYLMVAFVAVGIALSSPIRARWVAGFAILAGGIWLSGSRSAIAAGALVLLLWGMRHSRRGRVLLPGAIFLCALVVWFAADLHQRTSALDSLRLRQQFTTTSVRMLATEPLLGVGIGQYYALSSQFMPVGLPVAYPRENAHNNFLQIAAELGVVGLAGFIWLLSVALLRRRQRAATSLAAPERGARLGVLAFLVTCVTGHPLLVPEVAYPFWILLGVVAGGSTPTRLPRWGPRRWGVSSRLEDPWKKRRISMVGAVCSLLLVGSLVPRYARELRRLAGTDEGFHAWEQAESGRRYRWTGQRAVVFFPNQPGTVDLTLGAFHAQPATVPVRVHLSAGGSWQETVFLTDGRWSTIKIPLTVESLPFVRLDVRVDRTWSPMSDLGDMRVLGVMIGEVTSISPARILRSRIR